MSTSSSSRADALLAAQVRAAAAAAEEPLHKAYHEDNHEMRQRFRRLIDPGIVKHNDPRAISACFHTLLTLSDNLANDPENPKFQLFKTTNKTIKRTLVDVKGGLEYAVELGFRLDVQDLQPVYIFHPTPARLTSLRIGAEIIREVTLNRDIQEARTAEALKAAKAAKEAAVQKAMQAFEEDRRDVKRRGQLEQHKNEAAAARAVDASGSTSPLFTSPPAPATPSMRPVPDVLHQPVPNITMPGNLSAQDAIREHNELGLNDEDMNDAGEGMAVDGDDEGEDLPPPYRNATDARRCEGSEVPRFG